MFAIVCWSVVTVVTITICCRFVVQRLYPNRRVVHPLRRLGVTSSSRRTPACLMGGGPLFPGISVGVISRYPILTGDLARLYEDDRLPCKSVGICLPAYVEGEVCVRLPLHEIAPYVTSALRSQLLSCLPYSYCSRNVPIGELRLLSARLCCAGDCVQVYASLHRPANSVVNPFHIDRDAAARNNLSMDTPDLSSASIALVRDSIDVPDLPSRQFSAETFPPAPLSVVDRAEIINDWCTSISGGALHESACGTCASLCLKRDMSDVSASSTLLSPLRQQLESQDDLKAMICDAGVHLDANGQSSVSLCVECYNALRKNRVPSRALVNGRWLGEVPSQLLGLTFMEKILIARYRHNRCIVRVDIHAPYKMRANTVVFSQPVAKLLNVLPMPKAQLDEIVAVLFIGSVAPVSSDFQRTPVFVRPSRVWSALLWLREHHSSYSDVLLSNDNLLTYSDGEIPVAFFYQKTTAESKRLSPNFNSLTERSISRFELIYGFGTC